MKSGESGYYNTLPPQKYELVQNSFHFDLTLKSINTEHLKFLYLVMKVQSCNTLFSSWTPISGSEVTNWPLWRQCKVVFLSTSAAVQWKGSRSPLKTTWRWDGSSDSVCSSRGPSEQHGGEKKCRCERDTSFWTISAALITQPQQNVSRGCCKPAEPEQIGCRLQLFVNASHRISSENSSLIRLEMCSCRAAGVDLFPLFWSAYS